MLIPEYEQKATESETTHRINIFRWIVFFDLIIIVLVFLKNCSNIVLINVFEINKLVLSLDETLHT